MYANDFTDVPQWIDQGITVEKVSEIVEHGCEVTYAHAMETMNEHGDEVLEYLERTLGKIPEIPEGSSWPEIPVHFLSTATELWAYRMVGYEGYYYLDEDHNRQFIKWGDCDED